MFPRPPMALAMRRAIAVSLLFLILVLTRSVYHYLSVGAHIRGGEPLIGLDWKGHFRPATLRLMRGKSPFAPMIYNPPWTFVLLVPFAILPDAVGSAVLFVLNLMVPLFIGWRRGAGCTVLLLLALSPGLWGGAINGNIDWLVTLALVSPPALAPFFALIKPQVGFGLVVYLVWWSWHHAGLPGLLRTLGPVAMVLLLTFALYGVWPLRMTAAISYPWNASLWPASLIPGCMLLARAMQQRRPGWAFAVSPFFSPFVNGTSWPAAALGLVPSQAATAVMLLVAATLNH